MSTIPHTGVPVCSSPPSSAAPSAQAAVSHNRLVAALAGNSIRLAAVADRLGQHFKGAHDASDFFQLCFALARGIDYAISNEDIPRTAQRLPSLIKQVYQRRNDTSLQSAIVVLMISIKNACKNGWFHGVVADELVSMANELCSSFCMEVSATTEASNVLEIISKIMPRFYPKLKFLRLIVSFEAKPGYDVLMADFHIGRNLPPEERIMLFVAQIDNLETSSCIISPSQVSFLLNGKGVDRRTNVSQDSGPQFPTDITKMLKYGTNIIQAVGYFSGKYLIAIAFFGKITSSNAPILKDYIQPTVSALTSDSEIIEGASRITLNCPISFKRIKTPVKGHLCKHHQCFDYENFMEMNSRKPSWRCPCCNQPTCFVDLRMDQNIAKILGEVGEDVGDVAIFADGTWKVVPEHAGRQDADMEGHFNRSTSTLTDAVDLTMEEDFNSTSFNDKITIESEDRKPFLGTQGFSLPLFQSEPPRGNYTAVADQAASYQTRGDIRSMVFSPISTLNAVMAHATTDSVSLALNRGHISRPEVSRPTFSFPHESQVRQAVEHVQLLHQGPIPRYVNRRPVAIQALPVMAPPPSSSRGMRADVLNAATSILNSSSSASYQPIHSDGFNVNRDHQDYRQIRNSAVQIVGLPAPNSTSSRALSDQERLNHLRMHHATMSQPTNIVPQSSLDPIMAANLATRMQTGQVNSRVSWMSSSNPNPSQRAADALRANSLQESAPEQNWRPTGQMRGSLTGSAYSAALNHYLVPSTQPMTTRPPAPVAASTTNQL